MHFWMVCLALCQCTSVVLFHTNHPQYIPVALSDSHTRFFYNTLSIMLYLKFLSFLVFAPNLDHATEQHSNYDFRENILV